MYDSLKAIKTTTNQLAIKNKISAKSSINYAAVVSITTDYQYFELISFPYKSGPSLLKDLESAFLYSFGD